MLKKFKISKAIAYSALFICILLFSFIFFLSFSSEAVHAVEVVGKFTYVEGKVDVLREGYSTARTVKINDPVNNKDIVRTKSRAKAEITFQDGNILRIGQRSRIDISEYVTAPASRNVIDLPRGKVQAVVAQEMAKRISISPEANRFEVHTPNAVAGVRGTDFYVSYDRDNTIILVKEGNVCSYNISSPDQVVCMPPGYITIISGSNEPEQPRLATEAEFFRFEIEFRPSVAPKAFLGHSTQIDAIDMSGETFVIAETIQPLPEAGKLSTSILSEVKDTPASITDAPLTIPVTESYPDLVYPGKYVSSMQGIIWSNYPTTTDGSFDVTLQGKVSLWTATQSSPSASEINGTYSPLSSLPHLWFDSDVFSYNIIYGTNTTFDGGSYRGFLSGREVDNAPESLFVGLYMAPDDQVGILSGEFLGNITDTVLSMNGGLYPVGFGSTGVPPSDFYNTIATTSYAISGLGTLNGSGEINASGTNFLMNISGENLWGVSQILMSGTYTDPSSDSWNMLLNGSAGPGHKFVADLSGSKWSDSIVDSSVSGYWFDTRSSQPSTGIYIGETVGTFNPADYTWQAAVSGVWLETDRFLQMASTVDGRDKLQQLNIPAVEVGRTNLSGSLLRGQSGDFDYISVFMDDVIFFAPSTGQKPGIWATNSISAQYDFSHGELSPANIINQGNIVPLSGGGDMRAGFQFTNWDAGSNTWTSNIQNGSGTLSGGSYNGMVNFKGTAAGTITGTPNSGALNGTGAGLVK